MIFTTYLTTLLRLGIILASTDGKTFSSSNIISMEQLQLCTEHIWTDRELQFLRNNYNKLTYNELATRLNRSKGAIESRVANLKLRKSGSRWTTQLKFSTSKTIMKQNNLIQIIPNKTHPRENNS